MDNFTNLPILNMALAQCPQTKPQFLSELRDALVRVGFFYLTNHQLPDDVQQEAMQQAGAFFALPMDTKLKVDRIHNRHFFGYSRSASEITEGEADYSEGFLVCLFFSYTSSWSKDRSSSFSTSFLMQTLTNSP